MLLIILLYTFHFPLSKCLNDREENLHDIFIWNKTDYYPLSGMYNLLLHWVWNNNTLSLKQNTTNKNLLDLIIIIR